MVENTFGVLPGLHDTVVRQQNVDAAAMTARMHPSGQVQKQPAPANTRHGRGRNVRERGQPRAAVDCNPGTGDLFAGFGRVVGRQTTLMTGPHGPLLREGGCGPFWRARRRSRRLRWPSALLRPWSAKTPRRRRFAVVQHSRDPAGYSYSWSRAASEKTLRPLWRGDDRGGGERAARVPLHPVFFFRRPPRWFFIPAGFAARTLPTAAVTSSFSGLAAVVARSNGFDFSRADRTPFERAVCV